MTITLVRTTPDQIRKDEARFDVVTAFNVLHLTDAPSQTIADIHALLKPGGVFISKTPCLGEKTALLKPLIWIMQKLGMAPRVHFIDYGTLDGMIGNAGFEIVESGIYPEKTGSRFVVARRP